jgi:hypothetical protein
MDAYHTTPRWRCCVLEVVEWDQGGGGTHATPPQELISREVFGASGVEKGREVRGGGGGGGGRARRVTTSHGTPPGC